MNASKRFGRNIFSNAGGNAVHSVLQLGLLFVLFRQLNDSRYNAFMTATFLIGLLEMTSDYGGRLWATREFSITKDPARVLSQSIYVKLFYTAIATVTLGLVPLNTLTSFDFLLCVLVASTQPSTDPFLWFLRGRERLDVEAVVVLASRVGIVLGILTAALLGQPLVTLLMIWLTFNIGRMIVESRLQISKALFVRNVDSPEPSAKTTISRTIAAVFPVGTALVLTCLFQRMTLYLLETSAPEHDYKIYGTAFKLVSTSGFIATGVFVSSFAALAKAIEASDAAAIRTIIRRKLLLVTAVFLPVCVLGMLLSVPIVGRFPMPGFNDVASVMVLLMPALYLSCINMGLKYTLNAYALNWQDVGAVLLGIVALTIATLYHGDLSWWAAGAVGWSVGEATLLTARVGLLWKQKKHAGVPVGVIFGSAAALMLMAVVIGR